MATSRYTQASEPSYTGSAGSSTTTSSTSNSARTSESGLNTYNLDMMSGAGRDALTQLLAQLAAGGTPAQRAIQEQQMASLQQLDAQASQYTRETALKDAEGLMQQVLKQAMEQAMPSILLAQSSAGTSGDAISALLSQDLATRASQGAATAGVGAVADYGSVLANLLGTRATAANNMQDNVLASLLEALNIDKGSAQRGTVATKGSSNARSTGTQTQTQQNVSSGVQSSNKGDISSYSQSSGVIK